MKKQEKKLIIKGHDKNPFVKFWNWGWNIYYKNTELWNYLIVGGLTTILAIGSKLVLLKTLLDQTNGIELQIAEIVSWFIAVLFAFFANRIVVFKSKEKNIIKELVPFAGGRIFTQVIQMGIMFVFVTLMKLDSDSWVLVFTLICQVMQIVVNYFISKFIVFKKK